MFLFFHCYFKLIPTRWNNFFKFMQNIIVKVRSEFIMHEIIKNLLQLEIPESQTQTLVCIFDFWILPYSDRHMVSSNAYHVYVSTVLVIYISNSNKIIDIFLNFKLSSLYSLRMCLWILCKRFPLHYVVRNILYFLPFSDICIVSV